MFEGKMGRTCPVFNHGRKVVPELFPKKTYLVGKSFRISKMN
jgi:hypothetical protein